MLVLAICDESIVCVDVEVFVHWRLSLALSLRKSSIEPDTLTVTPYWTWVWVVWVAVVSLACTKPVVGGVSLGLSGGLYGKVVERGTNRLGSIAWFPEVNGSQASICAQSAGVRPGFGYRRVLAGILELAGIEVSDLHYLAVDA